MKTLCCGYEPKSGVPYPVMWNEFNRVVQCHNCGEVFIPTTLLAQLSGRMQREIDSLKEALAHYKNCPPPHPCIPEEKKEGS